MLDQGPRFLEWVAARTGDTFNEKISRAFGSLDRHNVIQCACVLSNYNGRSALVSLAVDRSLTREFIRAVFHYAFVQLGVKLIAYISSANTKSILLCERLGFRHESTVLDACSDGHLLIYTLVGTDCRWIGHHAKQL